LRRLRDGMRRISCDTGFSACSGACVDTSSDKKNCGGCGHTCNGNRTCQSGVCSRSNDQ
jgi:hypothetical protein